MQTHPHVTDRSRTPIARHRTAARYDRPPCRPRRTGHAGDRRPVRGQPRLPCGAGPHPARHCVRRTGFGPGRHDARGRAADCAADRSRPARRRRRTHRSHRAQRAGPVRAHAGTGRGPAGAPRRAALRLPAPRVLVGRSPAGTHPADLRAPGHRPRPAAGHRPLGDRGRHLPRVDRAPARAGRGPGHPPGSHRRADRDGARRAGCPAAGDPGRVAGHRRLHPGTGPGRRGPHDRGRHRPVRVHHRGPVPRPAPPARK